MINMVMSIIHRITGAALYFGSLLLAAWLISAAMGPEAFARVNELFGSFIGKVVLVGYTWALIHHMLGGIKHLVQDTGKAMEKNFTTKMAKWHFAGSILLTILLWFAAYAAR